MTCVMGLSLAQVALWWWLCDVLEITVMVPWHCCCSDVQKCEPVSEAKWIVCSLGEPWTEKRSICAWFKNWEEFSFVSWDNQVGVGSCFPAGSVKAFRFLWHRFEDSLPSSVKTLISIALSRALKRRLLVSSWAVQQVLLWAPQRASPSFTPKLAALVGAQLESVCSWPTPSPDWPGTPLVQRTNNESRAGRLKNTKMRKENDFRGRSFSVFHAASVSLSRVFLVRSLG